MDIIKLENELEIKPENKLEIKPGYIYCLFNPMFKHYGDDVYKLGQTNNLANRMNGYCTGYLDKSEYIITSSKLLDKNLGETILFNELYKYRMNSNREFFKCNIDIIKNAFQVVEKFFIENNTLEKVLEYYIKLTKNISNKTNNVSEKIDIAKVNKHILNLSLDEYNDFKIKKNDLYYYIIKNDKKLFNKIDLIFWLEKLLGNNRYDINMIQCDDVDTIKEELLKKVNDISILSDGIKSKNQLIARYKTKINKLSNNNMVKSLMADCYNSLGDIIQVTNKRIRNKETNKLDYIKLYKLL